MYLRVFGLLAALAPLTWSSTCDKKDPCCRYDVDGCSIPYGWDFFYKGLFTPSCDRHDICYHCGVAYGINMTTCDLTFKYNTLTACDEEYNTTRQGEMTSLRDHKQTVLKLLQQKTDEFTQPLVDEIHLFLKHFILPQEKELFLKTFIEKNLEAVVTKWAKQLTNLLATFYSNTEPNRLFEVQMANTSQVNNPSKTPLPDLSHDDALCQRIIVASELPDKSTPVKLNCDDVKLLTCHVFSYSYYTAVRIFGSTNYLLDPEFYCKQFFVPGCLPKHFI